MFHYTATTSKGMDQLVADLEQNLKKRAFGILWSFDLTGTLQAKGVDYTKPYRILEVCNPVKAQQVLSKDDLVGYFLPCKIAVYEDAGRTKIGMPKPTVLMQVINNPSLDLLAKEVEDALVDAITASL